MRCGQESGSVSVRLQVTQEPPEPNASLWDEVVEVSWHAPAGGAAFSGVCDPDQITPPWPGDYRVRVSARGRDGEPRPGQEVYEVVVWPAPAADPVVHKRSDRLGHALRGEPEPPAAPDQVYRWVESSPLLSEAATVTFVADKPSSEVLRAFGADESAPARLEDLLHRDDYENIDPWICVLDVPGGTVAIEINGWQGDKLPVLRALSSPDNLAASMFWNIMAVHRLALARNGDVLTQFEPGREDTTSPQALELLADLDLQGRHRNAIGLLAATRFTGVSLSAEDLARIEAVGVGYPILPLLPELHPVLRHPDGSLGRLTNGLLGPDIVLLADVPDDELRTLAWWAAAFTASHCELAEHPAVTASLAGRALTPEAETLTRHSELYGQDKHHQLWMTLHAATNPDPLAAAIDTLDAARFAIPDHAAELRDQARARLGWRSTPIL